MKIIPPVLFLTFAGFLPNDCDAMLRRSMLAQPSLHPEDSGEIEVTSQQGLKFQSVLMMDPAHRSRPDFLNARPIEKFAKYTACFITFPETLHKSPDLYSSVAASQGYVEPNYVPHTVEVMALGVKYFESEANWHKYNPAHPLLHPESKELARLYITIPNTKQVLHKLFKEIPAPAGVDYDIVRNLAYQSIQQKFMVQRGDIAPHRYRE